MPGTNLTRQEAQDRAKLITVDTYNVALDLTKGDRTFLADCEVRFSAADGAETFIDAITDRVHSIELNGVALDPTTHSDGVRIALPGLQAQNVLHVVADMRYTNTGEGLHRFVDPVDGEVYLYSQFEVPDSRRMYPVFEQPDLKASFTFTVTAPSAWTVVSNTPVAQRDELGDGVSRWAFQPTQRISSYITALIAGPYAGTTSTLTSVDGREIPLGVYCRASLVEYLDADDIFDITRKGFAFYEQAFGVPYPFEKYDQLFVPQFNAGAMENAGAITFTEAYVFRSQVPDAMRERRVVTILHELAHMWFGDLVTMRWWNDLWLNESFAEFMSTLATAEATEWTEAWTTFSAMEKSWAYRQDQLPSTHPIVANIRDLEDVQVNFDGITYAKGASVLKQLVAWVGREPFLAGVSEYFAKHAHGNTELRDLLVELEAASGRDLEAWSKVWLETAGVNTLRADFTLTPAGAYETFAVVQTTPPDHDVQRPHRLGIGLYSIEGDALTQTAHIEVDIDGPRTEIPDLVGQPQPDLLLVNDGDLAYAKIRLDERSQATALAHLGDIADPLARSLVWGALWDATRDAEFPASAFVNLVLENLGAETESTTIRTTLAQLRTTAEMYVAPERRTETRVRVADGAWRLAQNARPGSDAQFQFVKFFATVAMTPEQGETLKALLDGSVTLPGLTVDTDLKWDLLEGLAAVGIADQAWLEQALKADPTATGEQAYARAMGAIPNSAHKLDTMMRVMEDDTIPNSIVRATGVGVNRATDPALLEPLVEPLLGGLEAVWTQRSYAMADEIITGFYPTGLANAQLADATRAWLAEKDWPDALRRMIVEELAAVDRALTVQAYDAANGVS